MRKYKVATGMFWVEVPEADLRILCGCPADAVKHLMKKGFIRAEDKQGTACETGPNAILLSEIPLQNERFANLAEFPVLQMLYKQGLILPNHPNNTGARPLLIGVDEEVKAQAEYIYRGNYGLTSVEEIVEAGVPADQAAEMMRLKRRFAFDNIRKTGDLLDVRAVGGGQTEIRDGVFIRRTRTNVFEVSCNGESVAIDLNLSASEEYEPAYNLGFREVRREYFSVIHSGEGDGWDIDRPCMASILTWHGRIYLIDAGPNLLHSLQSLGIGVSEIEGIFHTHAHDDHFNGLTALLRSDHRIRYFATALVRASVLKKLSALASIDEALFRRYFDVCDLDADRWNNVEGLEVKPVYSPHPVETTVMYFRALWGDGYKTYAHYADTTALNVLEGMIADDPATSGVTRGYYGRVKQEYLTPVCLKKIDIGGGLIHGRAEDFEDDQTKRKLLSHTSRPLSNSEKEFGESATFGAADVLIPATQDYSKAIASRYLQSFFPSVPVYEIGMMLNCPVVSFNPGAILVARGEVNRDVFLILSGLLEFLASEHGVHNKLTAGAIAGELSGLMSTEARGTYRAVSFVRAVQIPSRLYVEFLKRNEIFESARSNVEKRRFLQNTWLFGERLSCPLKSKIAQAMVAGEIDDGRSPATGKGEGLFMLAEGEIALFADGGQIETLGPGGFFGEESIVGAGGTPVSARATKPSRLYRVPPGVIADIPIVQLKLLEIFRRRVRMRSVAQSL